MLQQPQLHCCDHENYANAAAYVSIFFRCCWCRCRWNAHRFGTRERTSRMTLAMQSKEISIGASRKARQQLIIDVNDNFLGCARKCPLWKFPIEQGFKTKNIIKQQKTIHKKMSYLKHPTKKYPKKRKKLMRMFSIFGIFLLGEFFVWDLFEPEIFFLWVFFITRYFWDVFFEAFFDR